MFLLESFFVFLMISVPLLILGAIFSYSAKNHNGVRRSQKMAFLEGAIGTGATLGFLLAGIIRELGIPYCRLRGLSCFRSYFFIFIMWLCSCERINKQTLFCH